MDHGACNVIYVDRRATDEHVARDSLAASSFARRSSQSAAAPAGQSYFAVAKTPSPDVCANVEAILSVFTQVSICGSGRSCLDHIARIANSSKSNVPTFVIIDVPYDEELRAKRLSREPRTPSPTSSRLIRMETEPDDTYGTHLLTHVSSEISSRNFSKLVVPIVMLSGLITNTPSTPAPSSLDKSLVLTDTVRLSRYLNAGAFDVLPSPMSVDRVHSLAIHAYRLQKEAARDEASFLTAKRNRKLSWVGVDEGKPYAYLREAMVSNLMTGICNPETVSDSIDASDFEIEPERRAVVEERVGTWAFSAHDLTDDELLYGALVMLEHALQIPDLAEWSMTEDELIIFLLASRTAYNEFVKYHNFRHVVDVLQALFHFLVRIGTLPTYPPTSVDDSAATKSPIAELLKPFDALTLLISAIGHDVGHPGVNNAFLVALNAPLAQLYNDRSVLESFHCAAYSQILRRYWPRVFADISMRKLMINNILATDMGLHFKYMTDLGSLQEKIAHEKGVLDGWSVKFREEQKDLTCGLLIKCADICNVARKFDTAARWANILTDEFSNQGLMEQELQMPSCLFGGPPVRDDMIKLAESQIGFMNIFARPLFEAVTDILPAMRFAVDEILTNQAVWEGKIDKERERRRKKSPLALGFLPRTFALDPTPSPFSGGPVRSSPASPGPTTPTGAPKSNPEPHADAHAPWGADKSSRRSSVSQGLAARGNQTASRRGSGDANLTAILVTQTPSSPGLQPSEPSSNHDDCPRADRKDTLTRSPSKKKRNSDNGRPVTAPSHNRRSQVVDLYPVQPTSHQSHSSIDLTQGVNGDFDGPKLQQWDTNQMSGDSNTARSDASRDSSWWRPKRRGRHDGDIHGHHKEAMLTPPTSHPDPHPHNSGSLSPNRQTTSGKIKNFFKRKPRGHDDQGKQLSSFGSSSQLRTPPTSDVGHSVHSGDD